MAFSKNSPLALLSCGTCHGHGYIDYKSCRECHGMTVGRMARGKWLYWGEPLNRYHIALRKAERILDRIHIAGALLLALLFLGLFVWQIYDRDLLTVVFTSEFWTGGGNFIVLLFWVSIIFWSYLIYRVALLKADVDEVEFHEYNKEPAHEEEHEMVEQWEQARQIPKKKKKDIADVYTAEARQVLEEAYRVADTNGNREMTPIHIFYALLSNQKIKGVFVRLGVAVETMQAPMEKAFESRKEQGVTPLVAKSAQQVFFQAYEEAYITRQVSVQVTDLLVATVQESEPIQEMLYDLAIEKDMLANVIEWLRIREKLRQQQRSLSRAAAHRSKYGLDRAMTAVATPFLNTYSQDITMAAKYGQLTPCIARDKEIEEIFRIIDGGRQSVLLVGEHGVGKMSIIEGLAQRMIEDTVPKRLQDKRLVQLSTSALMAGTTMSGAQERLMRIMSEVSRAKNIILCIHNLQDIVSGGTNSGEGLDVSETLSEYLGPGKFLTIASATTDGYNRHILNSEVGTVFARVDIKEMGENQTIQVLESKVGLTEYRHHVFFSYAALEKTVKLAVKFLQDQPLPESALSVMSEVASFVRAKKGENHLVTGEDVASIISEKTGIPMTSISEDESAKLLRLEEEMHKCVVGQEEAVTLVANALRRARADIRSTKRPIANFLFLGPTGVGKTELAKTIAEVYFGGEDQMIRLDMSEYQGKSDIHRMIGEPGRQGSGILTEAVRQHPFSLILLDEMEKANPDILNLFLQVFDDGRLTDSVGRLIDFTNTIIIATSNAGTQYVQDELKKGTDVEHVRQALIRGELQQYYRPEFLNRFDGIVLFRPLGREDIKQVASLMFKRIASDLEKRGVFLRVEPAALETLADIGFDPEFGARPMRRAIQDKVENALAELVLGGQLRRRDTVVIGAGAHISVEHG